MHLAAALFFALLMAASQARVLLDQPAPLYDVPESVEDYGGERRVMLPLLLQALLAAGLEDQQLGGLRRPEASDVRAVKRQRQCFWSAVTCY